MHVLSTGNNSTLPSVPSYNYTGNRKQQRGVGVKGRCREGCFFWELAHVPCMFVFQAWFVGRWTWWELSPYKWKAPLGPSTQASNPCLEETQTTKGKKTGGVSTVPSTRHLTLQDRLDMACTPTGSVGLLQCDRGAWWLHDLAKPISHLTLRRRISTRVEKANRRLFQLLLEQTDHFIQHLWGAINFILDNQIAKDSLFILTAGIPGWYHPFITNVITSVIMECPRQINK